MSPVPLIALEIHDASLWEPSRVFPIIETMERWGYNALVLHQNDLLDDCTHLGLTANYGVSDLRLKKVRNNVAWLNRLVVRLAKIDAKLFLEIKEPSFHDSVLEDYPELVGADGTPDPTDEAWLSFCRAKVDDLLDRVPGLGGLVVNLSSPESRVSMPDFVATSSAGLESDTWFDAMIDAFHGPLSEAGKSLFVRDFSYTSDLQSGVLKAINRCGGSVGASVKITAHDYFPEFPENPGAALVDGPLIFEFEAFGEHMGWGVIPNCRVKEFRDRMHGYRARGASGFLMRVSWEAIKATSALDTLSAVNVFALPQLIQRDKDERQLIDEWLHAEFGVDGVLGAKTADLLLRSWHIPAASYWDGRVFPRHSCLPSTWQEGWLSMETSGMGRRHQKLNIDKNDPKLTEEARIRLFQAKEKATRLAAQLAAEACDLAKQLPEPLRHQFSAFEWLEPFARQFELATKATFYAARDTGDDPMSRDQMARALLDLADQLQERLDARTDLPHHHHVLFAPAQIRSFVQSLDDRQ